MESCVVGTAFSGGSHMTRRGGWGFGRQRPCTVCDPTTLTFDVSPLTFIPQLLKRPLLSVSNDREVVLEQLPPLCLSVSLSNSFQAPLSSIFVLLFFPPSSFFPCFNHSFITILRPSCHSFYHTFFPIFLCHSYKSGFLSLLLSSLQSAFLRVCQPVCLSLFLSHPL